MIHINLPQERANNHYIHYNNCGESDYVFAISDNKYSKFMFLEEINSFILPELNYEKNDSQLCCCNIDFAREILNGTAKIKHLSKMQKAIIEKMINGKYEFSDNIFGDISSRRKDIVNKIIVSGNASIKFSTKAFPSVANVKFVLPKTMQLYQISLKSQPKSEWFVIADKELGNCEALKNMDYMVSPINQLIQQKQILRIDREYYYDKHEKAIVDNPPHPTIYQ